MSRPEGTRGARKLEAALEAFGLAPRIAGTDALDVGASTGGFTASLLAHGARSVTAIDVGRDQLDPGLRSDPRVRSLEQTDFRRMPLHVAEGPFDFFTVDVSFMAARNVLRPLAFRLRPGAHGVLLLKPQFELPDRQVKGGDVSAPALRARAYDRFAERARALGFRVRQRMDSKVAGGSGTIEMPLWLEFEGRPARLPKKGERKALAAKSNEQGESKRTHAQATAPASKRERSSSTTGKAPSTVAAPRTDTFTWFAVAAPGLEEPLAAELRALDLGEPRVVPGGIELDGPIATGYALNLGSRVASRVLMRIGEVHSRDLGPLRRRFSALPFERCLNPALPVHVSVTTHRCRLFHTGAITENLLLAASDRLGAPLTQQRGVTTDDTATEAASSVPEALEPFTRVLVRGQDDRFLVSIDTSGPLLHKRGYRIEAGRAPLRETLAAGMLLLADYDACEPLVDAMCGAGTLALEAASIATQSAPGLTRSFALERFPGFDPDLRTRAHAAATQRVLPAPPAPIVGFDRDRTAIARAQRNAERAGVNGHVRFEHAEVTSFVPPPGPGLLVSNPPYGHRLGDRAGARAAWHSLADTLRAHYRGYRVALLLPRGAPTRELGLRVRATHTLRNGGLPVTLLLAEV